MRNETIKNTFLVIVLLSFAFAAKGNAQETDERQQLIERQKQLDARIAKLRSEQDFLLFEKQMEESDSKYLLLDLSAGSGTLKYRSRILKNFSFSPVRSRRPPPGPVVLTAKEEQQGSRRRLIFGTALVLETKQKGGRRGDAARRLALLRRDMASLFYALDVGSPAYILPEPGAAPEHPAPKSF